MTQKEAAARARDAARIRGITLKLHTQTLSDYERGAIAKVPIHVLESLATVYGTSVSALVGASSSGAGADEAEHIVEQVQRLATRYRTRTTQGAPADELARLHRELAAAVRSGVEVGGLGDPALLDLVVDALVDLLAHSGMPLAARPRAEAPPKAPPKENKNSKR